MASPRNLAEANARFSLALFENLSEVDKKANVFFSPFSISAALAMVMLGAKGRTAKQMSQALQLTVEKSKEFCSPLQSLLDHRSEARMQMKSKMQMKIHQRKLPSYLSKVLKPEKDKEEEQSDKEEAQTDKEEPETGKEETQAGSDGDAEAEASKDEAQTSEDKPQAGEEECPTAQVDVHAKFAELLSELYKADAPYVLSVANRLYGEQSYEFIKEYLEETKKHYKAELETVDFKGNAEAARVTINKWVEVQTQEKIKNLLGMGAVNSMTKMVLVNAIYFKGLWEKKFEKEDTVDAQFKINKTESKPVKMMKQKNKFILKSITQMKVQLLEMPYQGEDLSMVILLPDEIEDETTGLEKLEKELTFEKFTEWTCPAAEDEDLKVEVSVKLPRFKMEESYDLRAALTKMSMVDAFSATMSDFSGMSSTKDLGLTSVVHKSFVAVDEEGTEAAAATEVTVSITSFGPPLQEFTADHPFLFFILHKPTKTILFAGRYCSPE